VQLLESQQFPTWQEDAETVVLQHSAVKIKTSPSQTSDLKPQTSSPDHLLRLFAYNDLMKRLGKEYFDKKSVQEELVGQAQEAYVVSPVSSLISLETERDYERFDIRPAGENSLKNASIKSSGAVPEPHEWVLLAVCFG
ncbi:MAG: XrtN system VIT domain-containing protein, partial [Bacteroidota bacterium]